MESSDDLSIPPFDLFYPSGHPPIMPPHPDVYQPRLQELRSLSMDNVSVISESDELNTKTVARPGLQQQRQKRRVVHGPDHVKHRRTRSGCYTCRQRRVKCDETRPICDRCRKGTRDCVYPDGSSSSKLERGSSRSKTSPNQPGSSPSEDESAKYPTSGLAVIADDDDEDADPTDFDPLSASTEGQQHIDWHDVSASPVDDKAYATGQHTSKPESVALSSLLSNPGLRSRWHTLPPDVKRYLRYHVDHMSLYHYAFKHDQHDFMKTTLIQLALDDESGALLYAVVAFAAYHHTLARKNLKISIFLSYYNKSIVLLQQSLKTRKPGVTTILTILQLGTIEEFLGDWVNLVGHQRAAYQILTDSFTPQTIMEDETRRMVLDWYIRFDIFAGMMSGGQTSLELEWHVACEQFSREEAQKNPHDFGAKCEEFLKMAKTLATEVTLIIAAKARGTMGHEDFVAQISDLTARFETLDHTLNTAFTDDSNFVQHFPDTPYPSADDITDYRDPHFLYRDDMFAMNFVLLDFWAIHLMFKLQVSIVMQQPPSPELTEMALRICKMFDAVEVHSQSQRSRDAIISCGASIGIAAVLLPRDRKHMMWCRRKCVTVEQMGYIYPATLRKRMCDVWGVDVAHWWLPNDEGCPPTVRAIRDFIEYRARVPDDDMGAHVRDMSGIFSNLDLGE